MIDLRGLRIVVAGAGAIGSVAALHLARRGARVTLADPAPPCDNASGVAAGMLAPLLEALLDPGAAGQYPILAAGRDAWTGFVAEDDGVLPPLDRSGALLKAEPDALRDFLARAAALGALAATIGPDEAARRAPGLAARGDWLLVPDDWRLDARAMLAGLHAALAANRGERVQASVLGLSDGRVAFNGADPRGADALIMATGPAGGGLTPIKGQILRFDSFGQSTGPVVRGEGVYAAPSGGGMIVGATMEEGLADRAIDAEAVARLRAGAARLFPALGQAPASAFAGVRAATPDGLPLVGLTSAPGVIVARGARRNGWLLAPLVAEAVAGLLTGAPPAGAEAFDPARFG